ncbi:MAG: ribbon-helix-helix domain-containing protein [Candidatus Thorarchaeota archaeon]
MRIVTVCLPTSYVDGMDQLVERDMYPSRSEIIRIAIRDLLVEELWSRGQEKRPVSDLQRKVTSVKERIQE